MFFSRLAAAGDKLQCYQCLEVGDCEGTSSKCTFKRDLNIFHLSFIKFEIIIYIFLFWKYCIKMKKNSSETIHSEWILPIVNTGTSMHLLSTVESVHATFFYLFFQTKKHKNFHNFIIMCNLLLFNNNFSLLSHTHTQLHDWFYTDYKIQVTLAVSQTKS